jgi:hypothetical protein
MLIHMAPKVMQLPERMRINTANTGAAPAIRRTKLRYPELSNAQIAKRVGTDPANVHRVLKRFLGDHSEQELKDFQENKAEIFDAIQLRTLMSINDADIAKAPLLPRITGAAILEDKARTIRGQATQINVSVLVDAARMLREIQERE